MKKWMLLVCAAMLVSLLTLSAAGTEVAQDGTEPSQAVTEAAVTAESTDTTETTEATEPTKPRPEPKNEDERIRYQIEDVHARTLERTGKESLGGFCGLQVSWELYLLGINNHLYTLDGNDHYDYYSALETTSGGYPVKSYSANEYSLRKALNTITLNGTRNVYNIMVGFEKTTTEAGQTFGHVTMIHAILNGYVYFVEGFVTPYTTVEGEAIVVTIDQFVEYWKGWTEYEGLVYFGTKDPLAIYDGRETDLFVKCSLDTPVYQLPEEGASLRTAVQGERLHVTGIYEDGLGTWYYRVDDDGVDGFVPVRNMTVLRYNYDSITVQDLKLPDRQQPGKFFYHGGQVQPGGLMVENVYVTVSQMNGETVMEAQTQQKSLGNWSLWNQLDFRQLEVGCYLYTVSADASCPYVSGEEVVLDTQRVQLAQCVFTVGNVVRQKTNEVFSTLEGWVFREGTWYYYEAGQPRTGWFCSDGVDYYLGEDGAVTTGWVELNGHLRYFTQTGALRTGWMYTQEGTYYLLRNGIRAKGWKTVDGARYLFGEDGSLRHDGWVKLDDRLYFLDENGQAAVGWVDLPEGRFSFHADGYLLSMWVDGQVVAYEGQWDPTGQTN